MSGYVYRGKEAHPQPLTGRTRPTPGHGTDSGYYRHRRITKTPPCEDCLRAHAAAERERCRRKYGVPWRRKKAVGTGWDNGDGPGRCDNTETPRASPDATKERRTDALP